MGKAYIVRIDEDGAAEIQLLDPYLIHVIEWTAEGQWEHIQFPEEEIENEEQMEQELEEAIEQETTSEKRNGELAHENFELKKRIAKLEEIDVVRCKECVYDNYGMCSHIYHEWEKHEADYFCADGERSNNG